MAVLQIKNFIKIYGGTKKAVDDLTLEVEAGDIYGFIGHNGAGKTTTIKAVAGILQPDSGEIYIKGKRVNIKTPADAVAHGIGYLSEDRKRYGLMLIKSVAENTAIASLDRYIRFGFISDGKIKDEAREYNNKLRTKTPSMDQLLKNLSGGNQQKVIIARWLIKNSDILIFDEPTRGIDVGAKSEIYTLINGLAAQGKSIIVISSELVEVLRLSDRVLVMCEGRKTGELDISEANQEKIMQLSTKREEINYGTAV